MNQRRAFSRFETLLLALLAFGSPALLWPVLAQGDEEERRSQTCAQNLKQVSLGVLQYIQDYDEKCPPLSVRSPLNPPDDNTPIGWADALQPYVRTTEIFGCPSDAAPPNTTRLNPESLTLRADSAQLSGYTDYWFNANLSRVASRSVTTPAQTLLFGDGDGLAINSNARYSLNAMPNAWLQAPTSPARRHLNAALYAHFDGHVVRVAAQDISTAPNAMHTFALN